MEKVIITGATGAIGIALIHELIEHKVEVTVVCHRESARKCHIPKSEYVHIVDCDLDELTTLTGTLDKDYDVFYHLAWSGTYGDARNDLECQIDNIRYTLDAVRLAHRSGCHTFIGAGSQAEYGRYEGVLRADTPTYPENGYGMAKLCAGQMSRQLCGQLGLKAIWTRILSVYGPYDGEKSMISSAIRDMMSGRQTHFTKGEQLWDYLYSGDAAEILYLLGLNGKADRTYVLGSGTVKPLREYIETLAKKMGVTTNLGIGDVPYADKQVMHLEADIEPLKEDLGYISKTTFDEGIDETIKYYLNTPSLP